ncbi:hypothetical protein [Streptomyces sp. ME19-01-6]|uniref:hypothetical protein n=1 Tax=Streptomyces sp. ME19-01-6 TaxID=3028686 RepID=UPI0039F4BE1C
MRRIIRAAGHSTELRRWYGHAPERFAEFAERYRPSWPNRSAARPSTTCATWPRPGR